MNTILEKELQLQRVLSSSLEYYSGELGRRDRMLQATYPTMMKRNMDYRALMDLTRTVKKGRKLWYRPKDVRSF